MEFIYILIIFLSPILPWVFLFLFARYFYKKVPKPYVLPMSFFLVISLIYIYELYHKAFLFESVPYGLIPEKILYNNEDYSGFAPSGRESGVRIFRIAEMTKDGKSLETLAETFAKTPVKETEDWGLQFSDWVPSNTELDIEDFICRYAFSLDLRPDVLKLLNEMINEPGNFYSLGGYSLVILSPSKKLFIYVYAD